MKWITPSMAVVDDWPGAESDPVLAAEWIEQGHTALVTDDEVARAVLRRLGLRECCVEDRLSFAESGTILCGSQHGPAN